MELLSYGDRLNLIAHGLGKQGNIYGDELADFSYHELEWFVGGMKM